MASRVPALAPSCVLLFCGVWLCGVIAAIDPGGVPPQWAESAQVIVGATGVGVGVLSAGRRLWTLLARTQAHDPRLTRIAILVMPALFGVWLWIVAVEIYAN